MKQYYLLVKLIFFILRDPRSMSVFRSLYLLLHNILIYSYVFLGYQKILVSLEEGALEPKKLIIVDYQSED